MSAGRSWRQVKPEVEAGLTQTRDALMTCQPEELAMLQARAQVLVQIIAWFEAGAPEDQMIGGEGAGY